MPVRELGLSEHALMPEIYWGIPPTSNSAAGHVSDVTKRKNFVKKIPKQSQHL